ncbi:sigma-70 family RNA polymerase sigma factor [Bradyrhizobium hipponense]|uniref:Sigma-70 family RNA polymerase sigma factor n=1 Tax=Bradyrhizobium hipponense TaxID=2605638 RepID=A0A5S4YSZ4_9BRAD|nr:sigma-70 family RNA polymerase sigma factor [Bradyrhizobium hipponense]TYO67506.1 sigma-70 family RNA polymerase sigma factor [Bradyrhizobium hipponense]
MTHDSHDHGPSLRLVGKDDRSGAHPTSQVARDVDWSILMARAQEGDRAAYHRLLQEITPYLRSLAARRHRDRGDVEDSVQDVLLTVHSIRQTYDPARPFAPWLVAIANRRFIDRLRRQGRTRDREIPLTAEHETFCESAANLGERPGERELEGMVSNLPPAQQNALRLLKLKELSLKEAAAVSGMSITSLKVNTHRALKNLRKMLLNRSEP